MGSPPSEAGMVHESVTESGEVDDGVACTFLGLPGKVAAGGGGGVVDGDGGVGLGTGTAAGEGGRGGGDGREGGEA